ncbi:Endonuclease/exonuclease/phosphatase [Trinorchestia longiramus]|nr:Endonuclease/exonuclease/phosphatase [Trinorchestia longiramus]
MHRQKNIKKLRCLYDILSSPHETLITGDFNLPHINWTTRQSQAPGSKLINLMSTNSLQQHVNEPTRGNNILDLVMTTTDLSINGLQVTDKIGDHQMIDFSLEVRVVPFTVVPKLFVIKYHLEVPYSRRVPPGSREIKFDQISLHFHNCTSRTRKSTKIS